MSISHLAKPKQLVLMQIEIHFHHKSHTYKHQRNQRDGWGSEIKTEVICMEDMLMLCASKKQIVEEL